MDYINSINIEPQTEEQLRAAEIVQEQIHPIQRSGGAATGAMPPFNTDLSTVAPSYKKRVRVIYYSVSVMKTKLSHGKKNHQISKSVLTRVKCSFYLGLL